MLVRGVVVCLFKKTRPRFLCQCAMSTTRPYHCLWFLTTVHVNTKTLVVIVNNNNAIHNPALSTITAIANKMVCTFRVYVSYLPGSNLSPLGRALVEGGWVTVHHGVARLQLDCFLERDSSVGIPSSRWPFFLEVAIQDYDSGGERDCSIV